MEKCEFGDWNNLRANERPMNGTRCASQRADIIGIASHEVESPGVRDRKPVGQNFRKFQDDVALAAGLSAQ